MKKKIIVYSFFIFFIFSCTNRNDQIDNREIEINNTGLQLEVAKYILISQFSFENQLLPENVKLTDFNRNTVITVDSLVNSNALLFLFYEENCDMCVKQELKNLVVNHRNGLLNKVFILTNYTNRRRLKFLLEECEVEFPVYVFEGSFFKEGKKNFNVPTYFTLLGEKKLNNVYLPAKELPNISDFYLKSVATKLKL